MNNDNTTTTGSRGILDSLKVIGKDGLGIVYTYGGMAIVKSADLIANTEHGRQANDTNFLDVLRLQGNLADYSSDNVAKWIDTMLARITFSESKLTADDKDFIDDAVKHITDEKLKKNAIRDLKHSIFKSKMIAKRNGDKAAKDALRTDLEKIVDDAMDAWKTSNS